MIASEMTKRIFRLLSPALTIFLFCAGNLHAQTLYDKRQKAAGVSGYFLCQIIEGKYGSKEADRRLHKALSGARLMDQYSWLQTDNGVAATLTVVEFTGSDCKPDKTRIRDLATALSSLDWD